jgi:type 1 glutamine amidotransferase
MIRPMSLGLFLTLVLFQSPLIAGMSGEEADGPWVVYEGTQGPGQGKSIVLVSGDEEYRSEEALPMLARILAYRHGFRCTVLFAVDPETGEINPDVQTNIPGLHHLDTADLMIIFTRFRELPDEQMKHIVDYVESGRPVVGIRTATHAFRYTRNPESAYSKYGFDSRAPGYEGGFGRQVLGETWVNHHGVHGKESTRGLVNGVFGKHPILRGVRDIWGPTDVYGIRNLHGGAEVLVYGLSLSGMEPESPPNFDKSVMPVAWIKTYSGRFGETSRVFATTMGDAVDLESEDLRRLLVNGAYWAAGMEDQIPEKGDVEYVGNYKPTFFGFGGFQKGVRPADHRFQP